MNNQSLQETIILQEKEIRRLKKKLNILYKSQVSIDDGYNFRRGEMKANFIQGLIAFGVTSLIIFIIFIGFVLGGLI